jgi:probable F420-dependent oxidoreductase
MMKIGAVFPQTEIGDDPDRIKLFATTAESLGYDHLIVFDHVLGASTRNRPDWAGPYTDKSMFHEPFVLFGYLAGLTTRIELVTAVIILPQRQTALVAKQAASLAVLAKGRLRLGVGTGWNAVEYEALDANFHNRGARSEEQIDVMRKLWADEVITYDGRWHKINEAGLNPLPPGRHIPVWLGGMAPQVIDRVGRLADGWFPFFNPNLAEQIARMRAIAHDHGRNPDDIGIEVMVSGAPDKLPDQVKRLADMGVTHVAVATMNQGLSPDAHTEALQRNIEAVSRT